MVKEVQFIRSVFLAGGNRQLLHLRLAGRPINYPSQKVPCPKVVVFFGPTFPSPHISVGRKPRGEDLAVTRLGESFPSVFRSYIALQVGGHQIQDRTPSTKARI